MQESIILRKKIDEFQMNHNSMLISLLHGAQISEEEVFMSKSTSKSSHLSKDESNQIGFQPVAKSTSPQNTILSFPSNRQLLTVEPNFGMNYPKVVQIPSGILQFGDTRQFSGLQLASMLNALTKNYVLDDSNLNQAPTTI